MNMRAVFLKKSIYLLNIMFQILVGVGHYANVYYVAYIKRSNNWEVYNDLTRKIKRVKKR